MEIIALEEYLKNNKGLSEIANAIYEELDMAKDQGTQVHSKALTVIAAYILPLVDGQIPSVEEIRKWKDKWVRIKADAAPFYYLQQ